MTSKKLSSREGLWWVSQRNHPINYKASSLMSTIQWFRLLPPSNPMSPWMRPPIRKLFVLWSCLKARSCHKSRSSDEMNSCRKSSLFSLCNAPGAAWSFPPPPPLLHSQVSGQSSLVTGHYSWSQFITPTALNFHQLSPLGQVGLVVAKSVCVSVWCPLPMRFFCVVGLVQSVPRPWTGAISISSRALKTRMCSGVWSRSWSRSRVDP